MYVEGKIVVYIVGKVVSAGKNVEIDLGGESRDFGCVVTEGHENNWSEWPVIGRLQH